MDPCFVCRQSHFEDGKLVPPRPDPFQACEHRDEQPKGFFSAEERAAIRQRYQTPPVRPAPPPAPPYLRRAHRRQLPGHERLERMLARRAAYLLETGRTEAA